MRDRLHEIEQLRASYSLNLHMHCFVHAGLIKAKITALEAEIAATTKPKIGTGLLRSSAKSSARRKSV
jgi:hypothetical protein